MKPSNSSLAKILSKELRLANHANMIDYNLLRQIRLTSEQKEKMKQIYSQIIKVDFRWGGKGYIQVSSLADINNQCCV